jgi:YD repeat-containing protein
MEREKGRRTGKSVLLTTTAFCAIAAVVGTSPAFGGNGSVTYAYDAVGRVITVTYDTGVTITYQYDANGNRTQQAITIGTPPPTCFPAGSIVEMADGRFVPIERVRVGELVLGRYGEANLVLALDRPLLGKRPLYRINAEHRTTAEHPHWTVDGPMAIDPGALEGDWGCYHAVILAGGAVEEWQNVGLMRPVLPLRIGQFAVHGDGFRRIARIEVCEPATAPADLQLYNLVLSGSHTMRVDGYLVTGWPQETDFDYDAWRPRPGVRFVHPRRPIIKAA